MTATAWRTMGLAMLLVGLVGGPGACGGDDGAAVKKTPICLRPSDCNSGLVCVQSYCVVPCVESRDCPAGQRCVKTNDGVACQPPEQKKCAYRSDCAQPLTCGVDLQCRNECHADVDCARGQKCTALSNQCADPVVDPNYDPASNEFTGTADAGVPDAADGSAPADAPQMVEAAAPTVDAGKPGVMVLDPCVPVDGGVAPEPVPNDDRDHPTALTLDAPLGGCLQTVADVDTYEFSAPAGGQGGWIVVRVTDLQARSYLRLRVFSAIDNGMIQEVFSRTDGADASAFFAAKAGAKFRATLSKYTDDPNHLGPFTISASYQPAVEAAEPNNTRAMATVIQAGAPVMGKYFGGLDVSTGPPPGDWIDWYRVTLPAGPVTLTLNDGPSDLMGGVEFYDPLGTSLMRTVALTPGADVKIANMAAAPGDYFVSVTVRDCCQPPAGAGVVLPVWATHPYTLTVTSP